MKSLLSIIKGRFTAKLVLPFYLFTFNNGGAAEAMESA